MVHKAVKVSKSFAVPREAVWAIARQFCGAWHPLIEWVKPEHSPSGQLIRCFKVKGEEGLYRERLTYFSDTDLEFSYEHLEGITNVKSYKAVFQVSPNDEGCLVTWQAKIEANEPRASEIAEGTEFVFEVGLAALAEQTNLQSQQILGMPKLGITVSAAKPGPLVIFLHGIGGNRSNWQSQVSAASHFFQAVALDLRGYGESELGPGQSTVDDHCNDILRVMAHFKKSKVIICGLSLGAWLATSFAMRHPEKISGLILSGGCTGMSEASSTERDAFLSARQKPLDAGLTPRDFADQVVQIIASPNASPEVKETLRNSMAAIQAKTYRDAVWCFAHPQEKFDFARVTCPVLLMTGEHDRLASPAEIRGVAKRILQAAKTPDVQFEIIGGAGHLCNLENPDDYNAYLSRFLSKFAS